MASSDNNKKINVPVNEAPQTPSSTPHGEFLVQLSPSTIAEIQRLSGNAAPSAIDLNDLINFDWNDANFRQQLSSHIYANIRASITEDGQLPCMAIPNPLRHLKLKLPRDCQPTTNCRDEP